MEASIAKVLMASALPLNQSMPLYKPDSIQPQFPPVENGHGHIVLLVSVGAPWQGGSTEALVGTNLVLPVATSAQETLGAPTQKALDTMSLM